MRFLALCWAVLAVMQETVPLVQRIDTSIFDYSSTLYNVEYLFTIHWSLAKGGNITIAMILQPNDGTPDFGNSWFGLGFGRGMLSTKTFAVSHNKHFLKGGNMVELHEHYGRKVYGNPIHEVVSSGNEITHPLQGYADGRYHGVIFQRPLQTDNPKHISYDPSVPENFIWSFNPNSTSVNKWFAGHKSIHCGAIEVVLSKGSLQNITINSYTWKRVHGFGMMAVWLLILPFGAFFARYFRYIAGWKIIKVLNQVVGLTGFMFLFSFIFTTNPKLDKIHSFLGLFVTFLVLLQIIFGVTALIGMSNDSFAQFRDWSKLFHKLVGYSLLLITLGQLALGIHILYPFRGLEISQAAWYVYFGLLGFWVFAFGGMEIYYFRSVRNWDQGYTKVPATLTKNVSLPKSLRRWTWESLDVDIKKGKMLVVGNGRYVYDISRWISSHPGGQLILQSVNGTDISNDYFHEAGFDASEFLQVEAVPQRNSAGKPVQIDGLSRADMISIKRQGSIASSNFSFEVDNSITFEHSDWAAITKARRTHVHTRLAIEKLASLIVGEIGHSDLRHTSSATLNEEQLQKFDKYEYRRYAITNIELKSAPEATNPFICVRFCLLYPYDRRAGQESAFKVGECVEIEAKLPNGNRISRYYTPISGNLNAFEILIKVRPDGKMTQYLYSTTPGEKQFKVRGPFGRPLVRSISKINQADQFDTIYSFCGGSGITPFLQLIDRLILPKRVPLLVMQTYRATLSDELTINPGDRVEVLHHYYDGWAYGVNHSTYQRGSFPVGCTLPPSQTHLVLFNISNLTADIMGSELIVGAQLAYPSLVKVHRFDSTTLTSDRVATLIGEEFERIQVIVCGPVGMNSRVADMMCEFGGNWAANMRVLSSDRPN